MDLQKTRFGNLFICEVKFSRNPMPSTIIQEMQTMINALPPPADMLNYWYLTKVNGISSKIKESVFSSHYRQGPYFMKFFFLLIVLFSNFLNALISIENTNNEKEMTVKVAGAELFCKIMGHGDPIFFIQGGPGLPYDMKTPVISKLTEKNLIVFFEHRGSYRSTGEVNCDTIKLDVFVEDLESLRKSFGFTKISLIGDCWGGSLAIKYAITHPESVDKLVLLSTLPASFEDLILSGIEFKSRLAPFKEEIHNIQKSQEFILGNQEASLRIQELNYIPHFYNSEQAKAYVLRWPLTLAAMTTVATMREILARTEYSKYFNWHSLLQELNNPTLIICGDNDWIPISSNEKIHKAIPNSKLIILKDCGHMTLYEKSDEVLKALKEFFAEKF